jgi:hypothetical protein
MNADPQMGQTGKMLFAPDGVTPSLSEAIEALVGKASFVDFTFPRCLPVLASAGETRFALLAGPDVLHQSFMASFRQLGGHQPIGFVGRETRSGGLSALRPLLPAGRVPVHVVDSLATARVLAALGDEESAVLLVPVELDTQAQAAPALLGIPGFALTCLLEEGPAPRLWLLYRSGLPAAAAPAQTVPDVQKIMPPEREKRVIAARQLVHDGGYRAEGDENYSWLWTGPDPCFRMVVPRGTDGFPRRIELSIVRTENPQNLDNIRVQIDGRHVPFLFERWSENSGKVVIELEACADYTVLGLIIPTLDTDKNSGRAIGLCVDKLILLPD